MLLPLNQHCSNLASVLGESEYVADWRNVVEWIQLAASVKSVEIDLIQHIQGFGYCSSADEYFISREDLLREFIKDISIFNFVWGGLESALKLIKPPKHPDKTKMGKIGNACYLLQLHYRSRPLLPFLSEEVESFRDAARSCFGYERVEKRFQNTIHIGLPGAGLYGVYELRNSFAHGSLEFPEPDGENRPESNHSSMVAHATRVVLISLQMLLLAHFKDSEEMITFSWGRCHDWEEYPLPMVLAGCHIEKDEEQQQQQQLLLLENA